MDEETLRLAAKGAGDPVKAVLQQAHATSANAHARLDAPELQDMPMREKVAALDAQTAVVEGMVGSTEAKKEESRAATRAENGAFAKSKTFKRQLIQFAPMALRDQKITDLGADAFAVRGSIGDSTPKMLEYLGRIEPVVERLDAGLTPYFRKVSPLKTLKDLRVELAKADGKQEAKASALPEATVAFRAAKGLLLQLIEDVNRIGRAAFDGQAEIAATFNKDLLLRGRRRASEPAEAPEAAAS